MPDNDEERRKAIAAAYNRMYAAKNPERIAANARARYEKKRDEILEKNRPRVEAWQKANPEAVREHKRRWREKNRAKIREANHKAIRDENGEITAKERKHQERNRAQRAKTMEDLAGRPRPEFCEVCGRPPDKGKSLHYDHCHQKGHFRGWICRGCNLTLGYVDHDPALLLKLHALLIRAKDGPVAQLNLPGV